MYKFLTLLALAGLATCGRVPVRISPHPVQGPIRFPQRWLEDLMALPSGNDNQEYDADSESSATAADSQRISSSSSASPSSTRTKSDRSGYAALPAPAYGAVKGAYVAPAAVPIAAAAPLIAAPIAAAPVAIAPAPEPYSFGYASGDEQGNQQERQEIADAAGRVTGAYAYRDANGLYRTVEYIADEAGFRAVVRTNEPGTAKVEDDPASTAFEVNPTPQVILQAIPVTPIAHAHADGYGPAPAVPVAAAPAIVTPLRQPFSIITVSRGALSAQRPLGPLPVPAPARPLLFATVAAAPAFPAPIAAAPIAAAPIAAAPFAVAQAPIAAAPIAAAPFAAAPVAYGKPAAIAINPQTLQRYRAIPFAFEQQQQQEY